MKLSHNAQDIIKATVLTVIVLSLLGGAMHYLDTVQTEYWKAFWSK